MNTHGQQKYQVRLDHGIAGAGRIAPGAHLVVVVDALDGHGLLSTDETVAAVLDAVAEASEGADRSEGADATERGDGPVHAETVEVLLVTTPADADGVARRVLERQADRGDRAVVAIVAAGAVEPDGFRPAVEDQLAAGAVVDALAAVGIDSSSPEAAVACAAAVSLRRATSHLLTASASAGELVATGRADLVSATRAS
ncbi:hypothetical protein ASF17_11365 [Frigoribacterium sp. Leaf263]|uniref:hypothetical protein n=1 Tax=Frigoribacterium sp. Leaf263 TaxID=1736313 RepID=UPI0006FAECBC|nr:hypothetical protein [Frigoribacterium sp. Leaf263]KQO81719.1 hypothetical protein ASF17_11365 [Frigoribacterium sp. Leaf263]